MTHAKRTYWLVCYDIRHPKRLARVHRFMKQEGIPLQYSVFLVPGTRQDMHEMLARLEERIDQREDDVRAYPIPNKNPWEFCLGASMIPEGILLGL